MTETDPFSEYRSADPQMRNLIEKMIARRNRRAAFQDFMQFLSTILGAGIAVYGLYLSASLIQGGSGAEIAGGAFIGGADLVAMAKVFVNQRATMQAAVPAPPP